MLMLNAFMLWMLFNIYSITHPISLSFLLIIYSIMIGYMVSYLSMMWFSYLLIIVFLGGVMVLIIYMSALSSNEKFNNMMNINVFYVIPSSVMMIVPCTLFMTMNKINYNVSYAHSLYNYGNLSMTILLFSYLFITMIVVVKLVKSEKGPLVKRL